MRHGTDCSETSSAQRPFSGAQAISDPARLRRATRATMAQFFVNGATFATWGVLIPSVKARFELSDAVLSLAMLAVAGGALLTMGRSGKWIARVGSGKGLMFSGVLYAFTLLAIPLAPQFWMLVALLLVFGTAMAAFDVAMSVQAALVENNRSRPIMSTLHAMFSIGGIAGSSLGALPGLSPLAHAALVGAGTLAVALTIRRFTLPDTCTMRPPRPPAAARTRGAWCWCWARSLSWRWLAKAGCMTGRRCTCATWRNRRRRW
ncbi:MAG: hypothetical protein GAK35_03829 [Herbaspirillum frisingense]|uniref:MFS transporter n=1 Tax=Herbaspirillum frisingense TaxID=92645 RepID=A0A7V8FTI4_9BURK|nr:MAG: hypothetical protein GAK35_03829 [Herbaspirillum frisingense]